MKTQIQTQTKHTPGPWHRGADAGNGRDSIFANEGRMRMEKGGTALYPIANLVEGWDEGEDCANAALIAAAPAMLEALEQATILLKHAWDDPALLHSQLADETAATMTKALEQAKNLPTG